MFRFEYIEHLYALVAIPILVFFFWWMIATKKRALSRFGEWALVSRLMPQFSKYKHTLKFILLVLGIGLLVVSWANPQWGTKREKVKRKSVDLFIALDISHSMYATDVAPNRMERARTFAQKLIEGLKGDRIGTIIFAGNAYLQMPLTVDYAAANLFIKSANPEMAPSQGTAISEAVDLAERSFEENNKQHKALIIITDGETHDEDAIERVRAAQENGLLVFTVGVGTIEGGYIPVFGNGQRDFKRDTDGSLVKTSLNVQMLKDLAEAGNGKYFSLTEDDVIVEALRTSISQMEKREFEQRMFNEFESYFQWFLGIGMLFLLIEFVISYRKNRWIGDKDLFQ